MNMCTVIDDKLPYDSVDGTLMCMSVFPHGEPRKGGGAAEAQWPSLLEKGVSSLVKMLLLTSSFLSQPLVYEVNGRI